MKKDIKSLSYAELDREIVTLGLPRFRSKQIFEWLHKYGVCLLYTSPSPRD